MGGFIMRYTIITMISAVCLLASCSLPEGKDIFDVPQDGYTLFEADFEDLTIAGTTGEMIWERGIGIGVYGSSKGENERYILKKALDGKAMGEFYGSEVSGEKITAYYPYSEDYALYNGHMMFSLSNVQAFDGTSDVFEQFCKYAGYAYAFKGDDNSLHFRYASGVLSIEVHLSNTETVRSIALTSDSPLAGVGSIGDDMTVSLSQTSSKTILLDCGTGVVSRNGETYTRYPVVIPAGTYMNVSALLTLEDGTEIISEMGTIEVERVTAGGQQVKEVVISTGGLGGFEVEGNLDFEPQS